MCGTEMHYAISCVKWSKAPQAQAVVSPNSDGLTGPFSLTIGLLDYASCGPRICSQSEKQVVTLFVFFKKKKPRPIPFEPRQYLAFNPLGFIWPRYLLSIQVCLFPETDYASISGK